MLTLRGTFDLDLGLLLFTKGNQTELLGSHVIHLCLPQLTVTSHFSFPPKLELESRNNVTPNCRVPKKKFWEFLLLCSVTRPLTSKIIKYSNRAFHILTVLSHEIPALMWFSSNNFVIFFYIFLLFSSQHIFPVTNFHSIKKGFCMNSGGITYCSSVSYLTALET